MLRLLKKLDAIKLASAGLDVQFTTEPSAYPTVIIEVVKEEVDVIGKIFKEIPKVEKLRELSNLKFSIFKQIATGLLDGEAVKSQLEWLSLCQEKVQKCVDSTGLYQEKVQISVDSPEDSPEGTSQGNRIAVFSRIKSLDCFRILPCEWLGHPLVMHSIYEMKDFDQRNDKNRKMTEELKRLYNKGLEDSYEDDIKAIMPKLVKTKEGFKDQWMRAWLFHGMHMGYDQVTFFKDIAKLHLKYADRIQEVFTKLSEGKEHVNGWVPIKAKELVKELNDAFEGKIVRIALVVEVWTGNFIVSEVQVGYNQDFDVVSFLPPVFVPKRGMKAPGDDDVIWIYIWCFRN